MPSQSPYVGVWANSQGHGMLHLQTSNQSPIAIQFGISPLAEAAVVVVAKSLY
jgi:hypothetical protein